MHPYPKIDFAVRPLVVVWEMTQACDLTCLHCRAEVQPRRHDGELSTDEAKQFMGQVAELDPGVLVLSGGDPMKRPDVYELVRYGQQRGIRMAMTPSVTPLLTDEAIHRLAAEGLSRIAFSLDGSTPEIHDSFRGVAGSFDRTIQAMQIARQVGLPLQINTTVSRHNMQDLPALAELLGKSDIELWSVFFLVPIGRGKADQRITPDEYEEVFELLWSLWQRVPFEIKSTEAPHYRRFVLQKLAMSRGLQPAGNSDSAEACITDGEPRGVKSAARYTSLNVNDGRGFVFVSHLGEVCPSGFLPTSVGNVRTAHLSDLYRSTPLMNQLRDSDLIGGKCGLCEYRKVCGGSRARSWALTGDPLAAEPDCTYQPSLHGSAANKGVKYGIEPVKTA